MAQISLLGYEQNDPGKKLWSTPNGIVKSMTTQEAQVNNLAPVLCYSDYCGLQAEHIQEREGGLSVVACCEECLR